MTAFSLGFWQTEPESGLDPVATPFEAWCEAKGVHPEAPRAWEQYVVGH
jgi:hypothetical protein